MVSSIIIYNPIIGLIIIIILIPSLFALAGVANNNKSNNNTNNIYNIILLVEFICVLHLGQGKRFGISAHGSKSSIKSVNAAL